MNPRVSIIIPCHNAAPWVAQTVESALRQTQDGCEVIVVDDGSTDDSVRAVEPFRDRGVRLATQPNSGASAARNHGLRLATGDFIQFLDADDLLAPEKIAEQLRRLAQTGNERAIASARWGRFVDDPASARFADEAVFRDFAPIEFLLLHVREGRMMHPAAWLVPRTIVNEAGPWDESLSLNDDGEYFARILARASRIAHAPGAASLYRSQVTGSLSRRRDRRALQSLFRSIELISQHVLTLEKSPRVTRALADYWQRTAYDFYPQAPGLYRRAVKTAREFGGSDVRPPMGARQQRLARWIGWKLTRRLGGLIGP